MSGGEMQGESNKPTNTGTAGRIRNFGKIRCHHGATAVDWESEGEFFSFFVNPIL